MNVFVVAASINEHVDRRFCPKMCYVEYTSRYDCNTKQTVIENLTNVRIQLMKYM